MIPLKYNLRNLRVRWVTTVLTVLGTGLVVWSSCILFGMVEGLEHSLRVSGDPLDLIILRKGSTTEGTGGFELRKAEELATLDGIARDSLDRPLVAAELLNIPVVERLDGSWTNLIVRGVDPASPQLRPAFTIVQGRYFEPGKGECVVSQHIARRFKGAALGGLLRVGEKEAYRVVGVFTAGGGAAESEVWVDRKDLERNTSAAGSVSCVQMRAASAADLEKLKVRISGDPQFKLMAWRESDYFANQERSSLFLKVAGTLIAVLLTIGAMFAAANTMYAAVSARTREIGTMRALGFSRFDVLVCFLSESVLICALGGLLGLLATLPLGALTFGTSDFDTFSERTIHFRFGPLVMAVAVVMTAAMGICGGLFPALRAVRLDVIKALREL
ncbi:MAG: ABC transporter permease [Isosphaeraceae bacterium]|nr:ABC transporter permease [Isosphaeraceae bacterium]